MRGEAAGVGQPAWSASEQAAEAIHVSAARDARPCSETVPGVMAIPGGEGRLEQRLHLRRKRVGRMVQPHRATATQHMRETRLMRGVR